MKLSVIMPAHNEEDHIESAVEEFRAEFAKEKIDFELVLVDDNSRDRTGRISDDIAKKYANVRVIHRTGRNGFGRAVIDGLAAARGDCMILAMADKSDDPEDAVKIFKKLEEGYDVVYGSRFMRGSEVHNYPTVKLIINRLANHFIMALFLIKENDITNAFKGYNARVIRALWPLDAAHFNITAELPLKARIRGFSKIAVPVRWYGRESGVSKLSIIRMGQRYLRTVLGIWFMWVWHIKPRRNNRGKDENWEHYWKEREGSNLLGKTLFKFREKFWVRTFTDFAVASSGKGKVLEAGSGSALSSIFLSRRRGDDITALDISAQAMKMAQASADKFNTRLNLVRGDLYHMPFSDKAFDLVWNSGTMEHFTDPVPVFKEMGRVGKEMICIVPAKGWAFSVLSAVTGIFGPDFKSYFVRDDEILYSTESLTKVLEQAGFKNMLVKRIYCLGFFPYIAAHCREGDL